MLWRPPKSTRIYTLCPYTTLCRSPAICIQGEARPIGGIPIDNRATGQIPACPVLIIRSGNAGLPVTTFSTADYYSTAKGARKRTADIGVALETVEATVEIGRANV